MLKNIYEELVKKADNTDTSKLVKKPDYDNKISDMEGKIPSITYLATTTALTAVKNTILTVRCKAIIYILL